MNCQAIIDQIIAQSGRPSPSTEVERHLWNCSSCSKVYLEQQALWRQMDAWEAPEVSAGFDRRLFARIGRGAAQPWPAWDWMMRLLRPLRPAFPAALACMLLIATVLVNKERYAPVPAQTTVATQTTERDDIDVALDDIRMLSDFDILPVEQAVEGKS